MIPSSFELKKPQQLLFILKDVFHLKYFVFDSGITG